MKNREIFVKDPLENRLVNQGVAEVVDPRTEQELKTLRSELEMFVCEGQYARGLERILSSYLKGLDREEQAAVWVSGFFGSGKSHLVKMLRFLWIDFQFADGATARGLAHLPESIRELLSELSTQGKRAGGLRAAGGKLGAGAGSSVRLELLHVVFRSLGLPGDFPAARFVMFLKKQGYYEKVRRAVEKESRSFEEELNDLYVSPVLASALLAADPTFAPSMKEVRSQIKAQFPREEDVSDEAMTFTLSEALSAGGELPCTLIVLDEVQQYISDNADRAYRVQEVAEAAAKRFGSRLLLVGTGQTAITGTPNLQKLQARFRLPVELSDSDVDTVVRKIVLAKKPAKEPAVRALLDECSGEISRHLNGTKIGARAEDRENLVADYPLLPTRRRFWERAMRAIDPSGTRAELRNQLTNVFEAVREVGNRPLGSVVPADFLYDQNKNVMVQSGVLLREIQELIERLRDGSEKGLLKSRLCALCLLIGKMPRDAGVDIGVKATPNALADLLIENLQEGSAALRQRVPELLDELAAEGTLLAVGGEYRLQTREGAAWESEYRSRLSSILNDLGGIASDRADLLRAAVSKAAGALKIPHGASKESRKVDLHFGQDAPSSGGPGIPVWVRDGWNEEEKSVEADSRAAGVDSPVVTVFLPRRGADELRKHLASVRAATEALNAKGHPTSAEGIEARTAMETRRKAAEAERDELLFAVLSGARVLLGGGQEKTGNDLAAKIAEAAEDALQRLYPRFADADHADWGTAVERARKGDLAALEAVGHKAETEQHKVCQAILGHVAGGKKGRDVRRHFAAPPFGWPQDAVDAALIVLTGTGHLRASVDGKPLTAQQLDQTKAGVTDFRLESATITVNQRVALRKLFQEATALPCKPNEEVATAPTFLEELKRRAKAAGGEAPFPAPPQPPKLEELSALAGNELLLAIFEARDELSSWATDWDVRRRTIDERRPRWENLERLFQHAERLPVADELRAELEAIRHQRSLLRDPDPTSPLRDRLIGDLRAALVAAHQAFALRYREELARLEAAAPWSALTPEQRTQVLSTRGLAAPPSVKVGTAEELVASLGESSLAGWATRHDALPQRFADALTEAAKLLEPAARRISLPHATLRNEAELEAWLTATRELLCAALAKSPVIL